jgi:hypothetical protein
MRVREAGAVLVGVSMMLVAVAFSTQLGMAQGDNNPDVIEVRHYQLTLDKAQRAGKSMQSINQLIAANPSLNAALDAGSDSTEKKPITQQAQICDSQYPQIAAIIKQNGLATREFIVIIGAVINDVTLVGMKRQGTLKAYPAGMITPQNAALIEANWDVFQAIGTQMTPPDTK